MQRRRKSLVHTFSACAKFPKLKLNCILLCYTKIVVYLLKGNTALRNNIALMVTATLLHSRQLIDFKGKGCISHVP